MNNTTYPITEKNVTEIVKTLKGNETGFNEFEKTLLYVIGALLILLIVLIVSFIIYVIGPKRKRRKIRKHSCIPYVREQIPNQENNAERYSSRPTRPVSDPEIYESLKDLIAEAPPLPPISTLPKRKPDETFKLLDKLNPANFSVEGKEVTTPGSRPRQPLPNEMEAARIMASNNFSQTMPRMQFPKPVPTPVMSSTMSRYTNRLSPPANMRPKRPVKPEILPPKPQPSNLSLSKPRPKSPVEVPNKYTLPPSEPNHEIPVENELMEKLKKRARLIPSSQEIPEQQITNNPTRTQPQPTKHEPYIHNELMQKLKKRAALIPDSQNQKEIQQPLNSAHHVKKPKSKPPPPTPRRSDSEDTWVDYYENRGSSEQIHMYNF